MSTTDRMKADMATAYDRIAEEYDHSGVEYYEPLARVLVARARLRAGDRVLDLGCGTGNVLFPAARAVAPGGTVVGIDLSRNMIARAEAAVSQQGLHDVTLAVMDGEAPEYPPASFDAVLSNVSVTLFPGAPAALRRYRDLLRPGGRLVFTAPVFDGDGFPSVLPSALKDTLRRMISLLHEVGFPKPYMDSGLWFGDAPSLRHALRSAGFDEVDVVEEPLTMAMESGEMWLRWLWVHAAMRLFWDRLDPRHQEELAAAIAEELDALRDVDGVIRYDVTARSVVAFPA
ncbi:class I SAM-dependent methyltransferase [Umezawaea sp. NPDC059074]|uniref:class I SAM-dependent methyltransferase n=1 Tax=Umezawaea sp. NPDC059074 TaxID=3346716 RepID=UPI0036CA5DEA